MDWKYTEENWKPIGGGKYEVSDLGHIRRVSTGKLLKPRLNSCGYQRVQLCIGGKAKWHFIHRLVAEEFVEGAGRQVNHRNEDKTDNRAENLEWCSASYNCKYNDIGKKRVANRMKPVTQIAISGEMIRTFPSIHEAARQVGCMAAHITSVCQGKRKSIGGYRWSYASDV